MYIPAAFRMGDPEEPETRETVHAFLRRHSFATLVTSGDDGPVATHLPLLLDPDRGPHGTLRGHLARENPQWPGLADGPVLAIFQGPHAYISPAWYATSPAVPTWNYTAVHAYGAARLLPEEALLPLLRESVATYEAPRAEPWRMELPEEWLARLMRGIVGFEIEIHRLEGKWKLSQNRPEGDRARVAGELLRSEDAAERETGRLMEALRSGHTPWV